MRKLPPLHAVRAFEAAARRGSFNLAGQELNVTASAISHQVRVIEEYFSQQLFRRVGRSVELQPGARDFLRSVTQALDQINAASQRLLLRSQSKLLNIRAAPTFATGWLVPRMTEFQADYPELEIRMSTAMSFTDFTNSDIDLAISYRADDISPDLASHRLMSEHLVPVCSPSYSEAHGPLTRPGDIRQCTLLHSLPRIGQWCNWLRVAGVEGVDSERGPKFQNTPMALEAAGAGLGFAIANLKFVETHIKEGNLVAPFKVEVPSHSGYYLIWQLARGNEPKIAAFRQWLLAKLARDRPGQELSEPARP